MDARLLLLLLPGMAAAISYDCLSMHPRETEPNVTKALEPPPYRICKLNATTDHCDSSDLTTFQAGQIVPVRVEAMPGSGKTFTTFLLEARLITDPTGPIGAWSTSDANCRVSPDSQACPVSADGNHDYVVQSDLNPKTSVTAHWTVPHYAYHMEIEFVATVANASRFYWEDDIHSVQFVIESSPDAPLPDTAGSQQDTLVVVSGLNDDPHDRLKEAQLAASMAQHRQELIDEEIQYSEGDWQLKQEEDRRAHEEMYKMEMEQYELQRQREEADRQARIQAEILDQEEHDALVYQEELQRRQEQEKEIEMTDLIDEINDIAIDAGDGAAHIGLSVGLLLSVIALLFA